MRFAGQRFVAAVHPLTSAVAVKPFVFVRAIVAASKLQHGATVLGLHNAAPMRTAQQRRGATTGGRWAAVVLGLPSLPCQRARTVRTLTCRS